MRKIVISSFIMLSLLCACHQSETKESNYHPDLTQTSKITAEMAYEGVNNYCHSTYDWSIAKDNPSIMYISMGKETESEYEVVFRSYTGAFVYFMSKKQVAKPKWQSMFQRSMSKAKQAPLIYLNT